VVAESLNKLVNTATVTPSAGETDPALPNNTATDSDVIAVLADLGITKTDGHLTVHAGDFVTYTIVVTNAGPAAGAGHVVDNMSAKLINVDWTCTPDAGATCTAAGLGNINDPVTLPAGKKVTFSVHGQVPGDATGLLTNVASITANVSGTDAGAQHGPDLSHVGSRRTLAAGALPNDDAHLAAWIANPQAHKPGVNMPGTAFAPDDLQALVAYLRSLR